MRLIKQFGAATCTRSNPASIMGALLVVGLDYILKTRRPDPAT